MQRERAMPGRNAGIRGIPDSRDAVPELVICLMPDLSGEMANRISQIFNNVDIPCQQSIIMTQLSPEAVSFLEELKELIPPDPEDPFEKVYYWEYLLEALDALLKEYSQKKDWEIQRIQEENITSRNYVLQTPVRTVRSVSIEKLKLLYPDLYGDLVFIGPHDLTRLIGKKALHKAVVELLGKDEAAAYERVNITDLRERLTGDELNTCLIVTQKELPPVVRKR